MDDLQEVKGHQASLFASEASKIIFRSRIAKVLSNFIANWVRSALGLVIHPDQAYAVLGRTIFENLMLLRDTIAYVLDREKDGSPRGITIPGSGGLHVKASLYMDDITAFCSHPLSVCRLISICDWFELALGAKDGLPEGVLENVSEGLGRAQKLGRSASLRNTMYKTVDKARKNIPNVAIILMATFVYGCIKLCVDPQYANAKFHYVLRFYLSPVLQRMGLALALPNDSNRWIISYHLCFMEKLAKKNTFDDKSIRKFPRDPMGIGCTLHLEDHQLMKDAFWSARNLLVFQSKELTLPECCRLAHSKVQDHMLRDTLKLGAAAAKT
eukprot:g40917.t1